MKTLTITTAIILFLASCVVAETRIPAGEISGKWTKDNSPYIVEGDITVPTDEKLVVYPEVTVQFNGPYSLTVNGTLQAGQRDEKKPRLIRDEKSRVLFTTDLTVNPQGWGGIRFVNSDEDCFIQDCVIENARVIGDGGGVYCESTELNIANVGFFNNEATGNGGGIAIVSESNVSIANIGMEENKAGIRGGGIYVANSEVSLANLAIAKNVNGGIYGEDAQLNLANCTISENTGAESGGGICIKSTELSVANVSISENYNGGIACLDQSDLTAVNASIRRNKGPEMGSGIYLVSSTLNLTNAAVNENQTVGIYARDNSAIALLNCSIQAIDRDSGTSLSKTNTSVRGD